MGTGNWIRNVLFHDIQRKLVYPVFLDKTTGTSKLNETNLIAGGCWCNTNIHVKQTECPTQ